MCAPASESSNTFNDTTTIARYRLQSETDLIQSARLLAKLLLSHNVQDSPFIKHKRLTSVVSTHLCWMCACEQCISNEKTYWLVHSNHPAKRYMKSVYSFIHVISQAHGALHEVFCKYKKSFTQHFQWLDYIFFGLLHPVDLIKWCCYNRKYFIIWISINFQSTSLQ